MTKTILSTMLVSTIFMGCVGTAQIAEAESTAKNSTVKVTKETKNIVEQNITKELPLKELMK
ncbi:MAG: hypothetical protein KU29_10225 [Sulfurovum sp. FS06-10]|nr:MAG: hypothetical protein KU29_10225 [Sulfurovum sp. FS06-10]